MHASNATSRFSDRVENYIRYRPGYPPQVLETLKKDCGLRPMQVIADIASGTGIWTGMLLENGNPVYAVEPNLDMRDDEQLLLTYGTDYQDVRHERTSDAVNEFFDPAPYRQCVFEMRQEFDHPGLEGRLLSSSYAPGPAHPKHQPMLRDLARIFDAHAENGRVAFDYKTRVYFGQPVATGPRQ